MINTLIPNIILKIKIIILINNIIINKIIILMIIINTIMMMNMNIVLKSTQINIMKQIKRKKVNLPNIEITVDMNV